MLFLPDPRRTGTLAWSLRCMPHTRPFQACLLVACVILAASWAQARKTELPAVRWNASAPGCEFQRGDDGRYRWRMVQNDLDMTVIVDSQELSKTNHRLYHVVGVYITVTYTGPGKFEFPGGARLEFVRHHNVIEGNLDPDQFSTKMQNDVDTLVFDTDREIKKNPEKRDEKMARAREYEKEVSEFIEFLSTQSLQEAVLTPGNPEVHGWVFFSTKNKWIGPWKSREEFILRVGMKDKMWEFPFSLPPDEGDLILRKRAE
jgi:hypothetical protein